MQEAVPAFGTGGLATTCSTTGCCCCTILPMTSTAFAAAFLSFIEARCYAFDEVFGEKIRALGERSRPRDLYDVINLHRNADFTAEAQAVREVVERKCTFKGIPFPTPEGLARFRDELLGEWQNMLGHQLRALPPIESFLNALPEFFDWLAGVAEPVILAAHPLAGGTEAVRAPLGAIGFEPRNVSYIETIRFAAANRLCIDLDYRDEQGRRSTRTIEPYSLRRTQAGDVLLMAVRADSGAARSYRTDRIEGASVTTRTFVARYPVELTPTGPLLIPDREAPRGGRLMPRAPWRSRASSYGPTYVYRCTVCGREFERKTHDAALRPHKNRSGGDCYGRYGMFVRTKY